MDQHGEPKNQTDVANAAVYEEVEHDPQGQYSEASVFQRRVLVW